MTASRPHSLFSGTLLALLFSAGGAVFFATKGIFAKFLYADGWNYEQVQVVRMLLALPLVFAWGVFKVGLKPLLQVPRHVLLGAAAAGICCYYVGAMVDFYALSLIDASVERVLIFSYPSMVVVLHSALYRRWPTARVLIALVLTYVGIVCVVTGFDLNILRANLKGAGLVLLAAFTMALYFLASDRWMKSVGSLPFTIYALLAACACLVIHAAVRLDLRELPTSGRDLALIAGLVLIATVLALVFTAEGVRRLGAQRAAVVSTVGPPATILMAAPLLGERMTGSQWFGMLLITVGILVLEFMRTKPAPPPAVD